MLDLGVVTDEAQLRASARLLFGDRWSLEGRIFRLVEDAPLRWEAGIVLRDAATGRGPVIVTRHVGLVEYLKAQSLLSTHADVLSHVDAAQIRGRHVVGVLPLHLAAAALVVTEVPLHIPPELRGQELTADQVAEYAGAPVSYSTRCVATW